MALGFEKDKIVIKEIMQHTKSSLGGADLQVGDQITHLQNQKLSSLEQLFEVYDEITSGSEVKLSYLRSGKKMQTTFKKKAASRRMIIKRKE